MLTGIGAFLTQKQGTISLLPMLAKTLIKRQQNYSATKWKLFAIVHFTQHIKNYLLGQHFLIIMDQRALVWIYSFEDGIVARWIEKLGYKL